MRLRVITEQTITRIYEVEAESEDDLRSETWAGWSREGDLLRGSKKGTEVVRSVWEVTSTD